MGSLVLLTPLTYSVFFLASLSLIAFPFFTGFYSKDFLLELLIVPLNLTHSIAYLFTLSAAFFTSIYSLRLLMIAMYSRPHFPLALLPFVKDSPSLISFPLLFLSISAVGFGFLTHDLFLGFGSKFYGSALFTLPEHLRLLDGLFFLSLSPSYSILALLPLFFLLLFFLILPFSNSSSSSSSIPSSSFISLPSSPNSSTPSFNSWRYSHIFDPSLLNHFNVFNLVFIRSLFSLSIFLYRFFDKGFLELFGPLGFFRSNHLLGFLFELSATGFFPHYGFILFSFVSFFVFLSSFGF
jgi:NADH-ubiquinone oxidoreductase chain 5